MAEREKRDILADFAQAIEKEDDSTQKQKVVVASQHVLRAEIEERNEMRPAALLQKRLVLVRDTMSKTASAQEKHQQKK